MYFRKKLKLDSSVNEKKIPCFLIENRFSCVYFFANKQIWSQFKKMDLFLLFKQKTSTKIWKFWLFWSFKVFTVGLGVIIFETQNYCKVCILNCWTESHSPFSFIYTINTGVRLLFAVQITDFSLFLEIIHFFHV